MAAAFWAGCHLTDVYFRDHKIPYPAGPAGIAVGLAFAFWAWGIAGVVAALLSRKKSE